MRFLFACLDEKHKGLEILRKVLKSFKSFLKKMAKMHYFSIFFKNINKACVKFLRFWTKNWNFWKILRYYSKIFKNLLEEFAKIPYFRIFFKKINKPCVTLLRVWTKNIIYWKCRENVRNCRKVFLRKLR